MSEFDPRMYHHHNRIKELRKEKGLTLKELGHKVGIRDNTLSQYETEKRNPKLEIWEKLADFFGVSTSYIQGLSYERVDPYETTMNELKKMRFNDDPEKDKVLHEQFENLFENIIGYYNEKIDELGSTIGNIQGEDDYFDP